jgi:hypothetical protein
VKGKLALVREADAERDLRQAKLVVSLQEVLGSFNATRDPYWCGGNPIVALNCRAK